MRSDEDLCNALGLRRMNIDVALVPSAHYPPERVAQFTDARDMLKIEREGLQRRQIELEQTLRNQMLEHIQEIEKSYALELSASINTLKEEQDAFLEQVVSRADALIQEAWGKLLETQDDAQIIRHLLNQSVEKINSRAFLEIRFNDAHASDANDWLVEQEAQGIYFDHIRFVPSSEIRPNCIKLLAKRGGSVVFDFREQEISILALMTGLISAKQDS
jgi:hypothetical protein